MTNEQVIAYYIGLLIQQYTGNTAVQTITFSDIPASGSFKFLYGTIISDSVLFSANNSTIEGVLEDLTGFTVSITDGSLAEAFLEINFSNNQALVIETTDNTLEDGGSDPITTITSGFLLKSAGTIQTLTKLNVMNQLPLIAQNAFNLIPTIQTLTFSAAPSVGSFTVELAVTSTPSITLTSTDAIAFNDDNQTINNKINAVLPSGSVAVTGALSDGAIVITFSGVNPNVIIIGSNTTLQTITITTNLAYGSQLDTIGKYVGVSRNGFSPSGPITLSDSDFFQLIQLGIIVNNFGSSLAQIQSLLYNFFQGHILVFDYQNMQMSYVINSGFFSNDLIYCFISEGLLPKPMGVLLSSVIVVPDAGDLFSFRTYLLASSGSPFNNYDTYVTTWPWVSYANAI